MLCLIGVHRLYTRVHIVYYHVLISEAYLQQRLYEDCFIRKLLAPSDASQDKNDDANYLISFFI